MAPATNKTTQLRQLALRQGDMEARTGAPCWIKPRGGVASGREPQRARDLRSPRKEVIYVPPPASPPPQPGAGGLRRRPASATAATTTAATAAVTVRRSPGSDIEKPEDVIDLGAPPRRLFRRASERQPGQRRRGLTPNPRLYPGPQPKPKPRPRRAESKRGRRGKRKLRPVPNSRLYRPGPPRLPPASPPPARPRAHWPPPPPASASLETASNVVLRRLHCSPDTPAPPPVCSPSPRSPSPGPRSQRALVVTLPSARAPRYHYQPASEHFRARQSATARTHSPPPAARPRSHLTNMDSATAEDRSEGNETLSAPSEFLAEFLSAIMRRQYAEALKYCRLILQYEPHNATAQSFYPLLRQKLRAVSPKQSASPSPALSASPPARSPPTLDSDEEPPPPAPPGHMDRGSSSEDDDQSDLELDSSHNSSPSLSISHHTSRTEYSTSGSAAGCSGGAGGGWDSSGSGGGERSASAPPDDNGNPPPTRVSLRARQTLTADDLENDNASAGGEPHQKLKSDSVSSLRRLRAQFACSIK